MRRVLLEYARARLAEKRGGGAARVEPFEVVSALDEDPEALVTLEGALALLCEIDPNGARVVELKFFGGLGNDEVAAIEGGACAARRHRVCKGVVFDGPGRIPTHPVDLESTVWTGASGFCTPPLASAPCPPSPT